MAENENEKYSDATPLVQLKQSTFYPSTSHIVHDYEDWPPAVASWTGLLQGLDGELSEQSITFIQPAATEYLSAFNIVNHTFQRIQRVLANEVRFPELGPDTKTTITAPFAAEILRLIMPNLQFYYEVPYAKGVCPCQQNAPGVRFLAHVGTATSVLCAPIALDDSLVQSIEGHSTLYASESSGTPSGSSRAQEQDSSVPRAQDGYVSNEGDSSMEDVGKDSENATMEDNYSGGRFSVSKPYDPVIYEAALRHLGVTESSSSCSSPPSLLKNLHFLVNHPTDHNCVAFPLVCTAPHTEILDVLTSTLLHRRVFSIFDPVLGLTFDPKGCKVQVLFAWLEKSSTSDCFDMHTAHAPLLSGVDSSCGLFDLSVYSSIVSLATYLSRIINLLSASIDKARVNKCFLQAALAAWRLDALQQHEEQYEVNRTESWVTQVQNELSVQNAQLFPEMSSEPTPHQTRSRTANELLCSGSPSNPPLNPPAASSPEQVKGKFRAAIDNKGGSHSTSSKPDKMKASSVGSKSGTQHSQPLKPIKGETLEAFEQRLGKNKWTSDEINNAVAVRKYLNKTSHAVSSMARTDGTNYLTTAVFMDRLLYFTSYCPAWIHLLIEDKYPGDILQDVYTTYVNVRLPLGKTLDSSSFDHQVMHDIKEGFTHVTTIFSPVQNEHTAQLYSDLNTHFAIQEEFQRFSDPGLKSMTVLSDAEHQVFLSTLSVVIHYSAQAAELLKDHPNPSEADCRLAWDGILDVVMAVSSAKLVVRREMKVPLSRNTVADIVCDEGDLWGSTAPLDFSFPTARLRTAAIRQLTNQLETKRPPSPDNESHSSPDLRKIQDSGTAFLIKQKQALMDHTFDRSQEIIRRLEQLMDKNTQSQIYARALSASYGSAICDASVSVGLPVPKAVSEALMKFEGVFADGKGTAEPETEIKPTMRTKKAVPISVPNLSQHDEIKSLAEELRPHMKPVEGLSESSQPDLNKLSESKKNPPDANETLADQLASIFLPFLFFEYKKLDGDAASAAIQGEFYIVSAIRFLAMLGIFEIPVFAVSTSGAAGRLICGWGRSIADVDPAEPFGVRKKPLNTKNPHNVLVMMADTNCPEWNITDPSDALKFAIFLIRLRTEYRKQLVEKFKMAVDQLVSDVKEAAGGNKDAQKRFRWRLADQIVEDPFWKLTSVLVSDERKKILERRRRKYENNGDDDVNNHEIDLSSVDKELEDARKFW